MQQHPLPLSRRILLLAGGALCLAGCVTVPPFTEKKLAIDGPLDSLDLLLNIGSFQAAGGASMNPITPKQRAALERFLPAILAKNGLQLPVFRSVGSGVYRDELLSMVEQVQSPRYLLAIQTDHLEVSAGVQTVWFQVKLVDRTVRQTAWTLHLGWRLEDKQPNLRAEETAGLLLSFMAQDGLIKLPAGKPVDLKGRPIENHSVFVTDIE